MTTPTNPAAILATRPNRFTTREEAGEINRRLKRAGLQSTAEDCYNYVHIIMAAHGNDQLVADIIDWVME